MSIPLIRERTQVRLSVQSLFDRALALCCGPVASAEKAVVGMPWPTLITWYQEGSSTLKVLEKAITRNAEQAPTTVVWYLYGDDGTTVLATVTDTVTLDVVNGEVFEVGRSRDYALLVEP